MNLQQYFEEYPSMSIRKLAQATGLNYAVLLKKSKEPIPGEPYDPSATNWKALEQALSKKNIDYTELEWERLNNTPKRGRYGKCPTIDDFNVGDLVYLRHSSDTPYKILFKTETHIVLMMQGTQKPLAWYHSTFLINGPTLKHRM